jgi:hypothetical protein
LLLVFAASLYSIVDGSGSARFRNPHVLTEPSAWFLHTMMLIVFGLLAGTIARVRFGAGLVRPAQIAVLAGALGCVVLAGMVGQIGYGSTWGFPLADLVWWFDVVMLVVELIATALAIVLGTPGCELGVVAELIEISGTSTPPSATAPPCIIGLHALDEWEHRLSPPEVKSSSRGPASGD